MLYRCLVALLLAILSGSISAGVGEGQELYDAYCQICHGGLGEGQTMGKPLTDVMANRLTDADLLSVITDGRSGTGMAAWGSSFSTSEIFDIATYVRTLQGKPGLSLGDDAAGPSDDPMVLAGEALFKGEAACSSCHSYRDQGGSVGPALDGLSTRLDEKSLQQALLNPSATIVVGYEAKEVVQQDGTVIRGRYRNDSELAVQIQSDDGRRWVTYFKDRVKSVSDSSESLMPDVFETLGAIEQEQLVAFLRSL
ncbi:MAG: c-type cytochrome [Proteobacteria bacterium]|nr:c-type cytochrome [Pseudomonadota bacterium]